MNKYSITFRPHINDNNKFEEALPFIIKSLNRALKYFYTVEKDDTRDRHLHAFIETDQRSDNFFRSVKKMLFDMFDATNTKIPIAWKVHRCHEDHDIKMVLGYQQKEKEFKRRDTNIDLSRLELCYKYYQENKPPDIETSKYKFVDMTKNTIKSYILDFCSRMKKPPDSTTLRKMLQEGYCNSNIPQNTLRRIMLETRVLYGEELDISECNEYDLPCLTDKGGNFSDLRYFVVEELLQYVPPEKREEFHKYF
jgi:hypothetical protein